MSPPLYHANRPPLLPGALISLPLGSIQPRGWLRNQLAIQAGGLSGHIDTFWPDLGPNSAWLGGDGEGWERGPYYLDGLIPLAYLLGDKQLQDKAQTWIEWTLTHQHPDGWLGPVQAPARPAYDVWPVMVMLKALTQYHEATADPRVLEAMTRFAAHLQKGLSNHPLVSWGIYRAQELALSLFWLYNRTAEPWLLDVARAVRQQAFDWSSHFSHLAYRSKVTENFSHATHVVNNAMGVKAPGLWYLLSHSPADRQAVYDALSNLDRYHGTVVGTFTGDEHLAGHGPTQGTELCAIVEYMFSLETLVALLGEPAFADRLEHIGFNALPAAFSADMWAHQYDQQVNQVLCSVAPRNWTNNGPASNIFGLEPNYGCCTANMHQGWPKFASHLWMATPDGGLATVAYAPSRVTARVAQGNQVTVVQETDYPFDPTIRLTIQVSEPATFPLLLRIPGWANEATIDDSEVALSPGTFHRIERTWHNGDQVTLHLPMPLTVSHRPDGGIAIAQGPLVFALKIGEEWTQIGGHVPHADWEVHPTTPWNYALDIDLAHPESSITIHRQPVGSAPFSTEGTPITLGIQGCRLPNWGWVKHSAGPVPKSPPVSHEPLEPLTLIPYGSTHLRIAEFPIVERI